MLIAACVVLFVASLPGGMVSLAFVSTGITVLTLGRVTYLRMIEGPEPVLDTQLALRRAARQSQQARLMREAFGTKTIAEPGRKLEEIEFSPLRRWLLVEDASVRGVLFDLRDEGLVLVRGELLCGDLAAGKPLPRSWRLEVLPQTGRILAWSGLGGDAPSRELACDRQTLCWLRARRDFGGVEPAELPLALAREIGATRTPYRC
jgi:hypothetical protein